MPLLGSLDVGVRAQGPFQGLIHAFELGESLAGEPFPPEGRRRCIKPNLQLETVAAPQNEEPVHQHLQEFVLRL